MAPDGAEQTALLGAVRVRQLATELDLRPTKALGQNFVHDANTVRRIVATAGVTRADEVLEVGPGLGSLTIELLATAGQPLVDLDGGHPAGWPRPSPSRTTGCLRF